MQAETPTNEDQLVAEPSAMKLRVSLMAQSTMTLLRGPDASELCYIKSMPTADETILRSIGALAI
jgi:hypothetical protein